MKQIVFGLTRAGLKPTVYHTRDPNHYVTDAVLKNIRVRFCKLQKRCTWLTAATEKVYQVPAQGRWFSPGTSVSSTTKVSRHDIAEILLKAALSTINQMNLKNIWTNTSNIWLGMRFSQWGHVWKGGVFKLQRHHLKQLYLMLTYVTPHPHTHTKHPLSQTIQRHHRSQYYLRWNYVPPFPPHPKQLSSRNTSRSTTSYSSCFISSVQAYCIFADNVRIFYI